MKKITIVAAAIIACIALLFVGFILGGRYYAKPVQEYLISYDAGLKIDTLKLLREKKESNATLFLERELAGQLAALQNLETSRLLTPRTSNFSKETRTKGAIYFSVFPRKETSSEVMQNLIKDLSYSPITSDLAKDPLFTSINESSKIEDSLFKEVMQRFDPNSLDFSERQLYERLQKAAEQGAEGKR